MNKVLDNMVGCFHRIGSLAAGITLACTLLLSGEAAAIPMNPNPGVFANDDGSTVFAHSDPVFAFERLDPLSDNLGIPTLFGFYFDGTDGMGQNAAVIFDNADQVGEIAFIDFSQGKVFDFEDSAVQPGGGFTTTPAGSGNIGFWLALLFPGQTNFTTYYTDPALNSGFDLSGAFQALADPSQYMIVFDVPAGQGAFTLGYRAEIFGISAVPEPSVFSLFALGLVSMVFHRKRFHA